MWSLFLTQFIEEHLASPPLRSNQGVTSNTQIIDRVIATIGKYTITYHLWYFLTCDKSIWIDLKEVHSNSQCNYEQKNGGHYFVNYF